MESKDSSNEEEKSSNHSNSSSSSRKEIDVNDNPKQEEEEGNKLSETQNTDIPSFKSYNMRWITLILYCLMSISNAVTWITFSPISDQVAEYFQISTFAVNALSLVFLAVYVPIVFVASWCLDHKGLRFGLVVGCIFTFVGSWIRVAGRWGFSSCMIGQILCGIGQPFILNAAPKVAQNWFPDNQRTIATTIGTVANALGTGLGFLIPPALVSKPSDVPFMLLIEAVIVTIISGVPAIVLRGEPPTPPSTSANEDRKEDYFQSMRVLFTDWNFWILFLEFGLGLGSFNTLATLVNQIVEPFGYSNNDSGNLGAIVIVLGLIGSGIAGIFVDKFRKFKNCHKFTIMICFIGAIGGGIILALVTKPNNFAAIAVAVSIIGFTMTPVLPVSLELSCEIAYPIGEATPSGLLITSGQIFAIIMTFSMNALINENKVIASLWLAVAFLILGFIITCFFFGKLKRLNLEQKQKSLHESINKTNNSIQLGKS